MLNNCLCQQSHTFSIERTPRASNLFPGRTLLQDFLHLKLKFYMLRSCIAGMFSKHVKSQLFAKDMFSLIRQEEYRSVLPRLS